MKILTKNLQSIKNSPTKSSTKSSIKSSPKNSSPSPQESALGTADGEPPSQPGFLRPTASSQPFQHSPPSLSYVSLPMPSSMPPLVAIENFSTYAAPVKRLSHHATHIYQQLSALPITTRTQHFFKNNNPMLKEKSAQEKSSAEKNNQTSFQNPYYLDLEPNSAHNPLPSERVRIAFVSKKDMLGIKPKNKPTNEPKNKPKNAAENNKAACPDVLAWNDETPTGNAIAGCGDIAICLPVIYKNAQQEGIAKYIYTLEIILHGMWHLFGMRHDYQETSLKKIAQTQKIFLQKWIFQNKK